MVSAIKIDGSQAARTGARGDRGRAPAAIGDRHIVRRRARARAGRAERSTSSCSAGTYIRTLGRRPRPPAGRWRPPAQPAPHGGRRVHDRRGRSARRRARCCRSTPPCDRCRRSTVADDVAGADRQRARAARGSTAPGRGRCTTAIADCSPCTRRSATPRPSPPSCFPPRPTGSVGSVLVVTDTSKQPFPGETTVITIGAYDGLHLGHQAVIAQVRAIAAERGAKSAVVTFDRHPATVVRPESAPKLLTDDEQRLELFEQTGIDAAVVLPFDEHQAQEPPLAFIERVLFKCLRTEVRRRRRRLPLRPPPRGQRRPAARGRFDLRVRGRAVAPRAPRRRRRRAGQQHGHPACPRRRRRRAGGDDARSSVRGARRGGGRRQAWPLARLPDRQRRSSQPGVPARRRGVRRLVRAPRRRASTPAPSTSAAGRRSTSTPITRCSRPT